MHPDTIDIAKNAIANAQKGAVATALGGVLSGAASTTLTTTATHYLFWTTVTTTTVISLPLVLVSAGTGALIAGVVSAGISAHRCRKRRKASEEGLGLLELSG